VRGAAAGWARAAAAAGVVVVLDQATKAIAVAALAPGESVNVFFGLDLTNTRNTGIAFGALAGGGLPLVVVTALALSLLVGYFALHAGRRHLWLPVGMVLGGALGNLADRGREGSVIDFLDPIAWPAFNLADSAIVVGVFGLLYLHEGGRGREGGRAGRARRA
jgi:signal peptidase II